MLRSQDIQVFVRSRPIAELEEVFNKCQFPSSSDAAFNQLKRIYKNTDGDTFEKPFRELLKKLLQSKHSAYFKTSCETILKFLKHVSKLADEAKTSQVKSTTRRGVKRKADVSDDDELVADIQPSNISMIDKRKSVSSSQTPGFISSHDRLITSCMDVVDHYMQVVDEDCRFNAVYFVHKFLSHIENLDEEICNAFKVTLPQRIRDKKPIIRAHAVYASRTFQDHKLIKDAFLHHFYRDPELLVRKALLQIMDTKVFGYQFLVESTQDAHESMRKDAFRRLGKLLPSELTKEQIHRVLRNGLSEQERLASYFFRTNTLDHWLNVLYDGTDLYKLLESFDVLNNQKDIGGLLQLICERDLQQLENNGTTTKLHLTVEAFRERWLQTENNASLPALENLDVNLVTIWLNLVDFCKKNQIMIKSIKIRTVESEQIEHETIQKILESQVQEDDVVELYERLTPDLIHLVDFLQRYISYLDTKLKSKDCDLIEYEFVYQKLMTFICSYEIGDELERKTIHDVLGSILRENLLTGKFENFILPIIKCLSTLIYSSNHNLLINYVSEIINNVRSHLEDIMASTRTPTPATSRRLDATPAQASPVAPRSDKRMSFDPAIDRDQLEYRIANLRVQIEDLKDSYDEHLKNKDFDQAKATDAKLTELKAELTMLHARRCSIASDVSMMDMVIEKEPTGEGKLCSTMIEGDVSMNDSDLSSDDKEEVKVFKHHPNELIKCLQMYYGCLQSVNITTVPLTMLNHLEHLSLECLDEYYKDNTRVRSLMVACNGLTGLVDYEYAKRPILMALLCGSCYDLTSLETRTNGFKSLVDVICQHEDIEFPYKDIEKFLNLSLREYGKVSEADMKKQEYDFQTAVVEGTAKLFYFRKFSSAAILSHLILWWYHPNTHSKLKQFIGIFLPSFVEDIRQKIDPNITEDETWLKDLLEETFVTSIEFLHAYILKSAGAIMSAGDLVSLIKFLSNLVPVSYHPGISEKLDERIDELSSKNLDLVKYLKQAKNSLTTVTKAKVMTPRDSNSPISARTPPLEDLAQAVE